MRVVLVLAAVTAACVGGALTARAGNAPPDRLRELEGHFGEVTRYRIEAWNAYAKGDGAGAEKWLAGVDELLRATRKEIDKAQRAGLAAPFAKVMQQLVGELGEQTRDLHGVVKAKDDGREPWTRISRTEAYVRSVLDALGDSHLLPSVDLARLGTSLVDAERDAGAAAAALVVRDRGEARRALVRAELALAAAERSSKRALALDQLDDAEFERLDAKLSTAREQLDAAKEDLAEAPLEQAAKALRGALPVVQQALKRPAAAAGSRGAGPECKPGSLASTSVSIRTPAYRDTAFFSVPVSIPNSAYFDHKHGYTSGGCFHGAKGLRIDIDVFDELGDRVAWSYDTAPYPQDVAARSGGGCSSQSGTPPVKVHDCKVGVPALAWPYPEQGFVPPAGYSRNTSDLRWYAVVVPITNDDQTAVRGGDVYSIRVAARWTVVK